MDTAILTEVFEFPAIEGQKNEFLIQSRLPPLRAKIEMTPEDWDKFEKDIEDSFEQVP